MRALLFLALLLSACRTSNGLLTEIELNKVLENKQRLNTNILNVYYKGDSEKARHFVIKSKEYKTVKDSFSHVEAKPLRTDAKNWCTVNLKEIDLNGLKSPSYSPSKAHEVIKGSN